MCSPQPPAPPDTVGAARAQSEGNIDAAKTTNLLNNPNVVNQYGTTTFTDGQDTFDQAGYDAAMAKPNASAQYLSENPDVANSTNWSGTPEEHWNMYGRKEGRKWYGDTDSSGNAIATAVNRADFIKKGRGTMIQKLSPEQQAIFDQMTGNKLNLGKLAGQGIDSMKGLIGTQFDISGAPAAPGNQDEVRKRVIDAMMSRVDQRLGESNTQQDSDLIAAGIRPGTKAWDVAKDQQGRNRNDALMQAEIMGGQEASRAFGMGTDARKNYIAELLAKRQIPLNEITALMSGSQTGNPFAGGGAQGGAAVQPTDYMSGMNMLNQYNQDIYNQGVGQRNANIGAGATIISAFSDRRLKKDIERIGTHKLGIGIYKWTYLWGEKAIGVMAQELVEVMPQAVITLPSGYMAVRYDMIGA